jgi:hypothetical protein
MPAWHGAPLELTEETDSGTQRAFSLRPRCIGVTRTANQSTIPGTQPKTMFRLCPRTLPIPRRFTVCRDVLSFEGQELQAPRPTPKLEDRPLEAVR